MNDVDHVDRAVYENINLFRKTLVSFADIISFDVIFSVNKKMETKDYFKLSFATLVKVEKVDYLERNGVFRDEISNRVNSPRAYLFDFDFRLRDLKIVVQNF